jgi:hypothetical protein
MCTPKQYIHIKQCLEKIERQNSIYDIYTLGTFPNIFFTFRLIDFIFLFLQGSL